MPKAKWGIGTEEPEELEQFAVYDGDEPPTGVYPFVLKRLTVKENKNGDDMLNGLVEIRAPKSDKKSKYNGWAVWFNQNVTDQGAPYVKQWLKSLGLTWKDFTNKTVLESDERPCKVVKIGNVKFNDGNEPPLRATIKMGRKSGDYPARLEIGQWLAPQEESGDWDGADDGDEPDEDDPFA